MSEAVLEWADGALLAAAQQARRTAPCGRFEPIDPGGIAVSRLAALEACKARIDAEICTLLVGLTGRAASWIDHTDTFTRYNPTPTDIAAAEISAALSWTTVAATVRIDLAQRLVEDLPATFAALAAGTIDLTKARIIADTTLHLDDDTARQVADHVLGKAPGQTTGELRAALRRAIIKADPDGAEQRRTKARDGRSVRIQQLNDDMAELSAALAADDAVGIYRHLDNLARAAGSFDERTMDQRRADILRDLLLGEPLDKWLPDPGPDDDIDLPDHDTVDPYDADTEDTAADATDVTDADASAAATAEPEPAKPEPLLDLTTTREVLDGTSDEPADLAGYGPITAGHARELARSGRANIHLLDQLQRQIEELRDTVYAGHDPPPKLAAAVKARDGTCRFPHCRQPAARCDIDHTIRWPDGPTALWNLGCLCRRHHGIKHRTRWRVIQLPGGVFEWTSPTGRVYRTYPRGPAHFATD